MDIQELFKLGMKRDIPELLPMPDGTILNIGAGNTSIPGTAPLGLPDWDADKHAIPFSDGFISGIHAYHFLEHVADPIEMLHEFQRVLKPGGVINIVVPYYSSMMAVQDLTHKSFFCEESWQKVFANPYTGPLVAWDWELKVHANFIMGIVQRNLALFTQLVKEES